ncbi:MAG TPA: hypothetical protein VNZ22_21545 [Bacillota bacterium]|nr:hypothetical protein [Bacillota bacterium]
MLAEYVQTGSEAAFRELVSRYLDLVYSTALRRVGGDAHLAQGVVQTVFLHLARKGSGLSGQVILGGYRDACYVAAKLMRGERRRLNCERQAVELQALADHQQAHLSEAAPFLDQASRLPTASAEPASSELLRLRNQAGLLRQAQEDVDRLQAEANALRQQFQVALVDATETRTNREQRVLEAKQEFAGDLATSVILYWSSNSRVCRLA